MPRLNDTWELSTKLGSGSFGEVYVAVDDDGGAVAVKMETRDNDAPRQLEYEYRVYKHLHKGSVDCIPEVLWFGQSKDYNFLVMEKLGPSLEVVLQKSGGTLQENEAAALGILGVRSLRQIHENGIVHRDIKPQNICLDPMGRKKLYLIDFGLCKKIRDRDGQHIRYINGKKLTGTPRFCSMRTLAGVEQSRRDDLEGWAFCLLYFLRGRLPWQGINLPKKEKHAKILTMKQTITTEDLIKGFSAVWGSLLEKIRNLEFDEAPKYEVYESMLRTLL